ncbi:putative TatD family hydrolase [Monocercomonoides exilis]|uniref:putative TatD family hydrolase n=1 Tax=Monocercomonoides exilis TaxID=2049356 RepID=UPI0035593C24|nr:putative TatD family hydrolase [Monocercomonoides exilis]|eukprot:MONOS_3724.1-p1 / transcript=MONOS_3724.1 / gene=MONOS_3724 / organism=Monocercomonoides_exilis_PA203 / gene_product=TatD family hydrolase / transcript_product=TatD family hydrolase / location=Mono_scaffold00090:107429-108545(+) / protein_length=268 / sequence_SO=supercontig / SO=protein_coding / is_pseudo=false
MQSTFIDAHTHIDATLQKLEYFDGFEKFREDVIKCPQCEKFVHVACDEASLPGGVDLMLRYQDVYGCFGIHPHNSKEYTPELEERLVDIFRKYGETGKVLGWGEIGLDYHYDFCPRDLQKEVFIRQLKKAVELKLRIILHIREADDDALAIIREHVPKDHIIHLHCYTSDPPFAKALVEEYPNAFVGFTGVVTFKSAKGVVDSVAALPLNRILLETDAPYMAPVPFRGKTCHSGMIPSTAQKIALIKGVSVDEVYRQTRENTRKCYGI